MTPTGRQAQVSFIITKTLRLSIPDTRYLASVMVGINRAGGLCASVTHSQDISDSVADHVSLELAFAGYFKVDIQWIIRPDWETEGYKVVRRTPAGNLLSAWANADKGQRKYTEGQWVIPRRGCGPLSVFRTESTAQGYAYKEKLGSKGRPLFCIYHCVYKPAPPGRSLWYWVGSADCSKHYTGDLPYGTKLAQAVKLTNEALYHDGISYGDIARKEKP